MPNREELTMSVPEAAKILGKQPESIRCAIKQGALPFALGWEGDTGQWNFIISKPALMRWIERGGKISDDGIQYLTEGTE